jgi:hypothetical protein
MDSASNPSVPIAFSIKGYVIPYLLIMAVLYEKVEDWREGRR